MNPIRINLRHIEPGGSVQVVLTEIAGRCGPEPFLLPPVHRLPRQAREAAAAQLYLHKADGAVSVPGLGGIHVRRASHFFRKVRRWAGQGPYRSSIS